jgi:broad specificity phosphatase PhoE
MGGRAEIELSMTTRAEFPVHLVRHGETVSYTGDAGLTDLGHQQASARARALGEIISEGEHVGVVHAPTERARRTADVMRSELLAVARERGRPVSIGPPREEPGFANVTVWVDGRAWEPTQVRAEHRRLAAEADQSGWVTEASRFWQADETPGGAMGFWLTTPLLWHESPAAVVHRTLLSASRHACADDAPDRLLVTTHAGCLRALVAWAAGTDMGEPDNTEEVTLVLLPDYHAQITFRGQTWRARFPSGLRLGNLVE